MHAPRLRLSLSELTGVVLVAAMALAQLTSRIAPVGGAIRMAVIGICIVAAAGALPLRSRWRRFRLGFAAGTSFFLLVHGWFPIILLLVPGWFQIPGLFGRIDLGLMFEAALAIACGILGGRISRRMRAPARTADEMPSTHSLSS
jgi:hypothetical protein